MPYKINERSKPNLSFIEKRDKAIDVSISSYLCSIMDKSRNTTSLENLTINSDLLKKNKIKFFHRNTIECDQFCL